MIDILKTIGDENRLRIINLLLENELCVCEIETILDLNQSNVSRHLNKLKYAQITSSSKDGQWIHYRISDNFRKQNQLLIEYLRDKFMKLETFASDIQKYKIYKEQNFSCKNIREDKELVLNLIGGKEIEK